MEEKERKPKIRFKGFTEAWEQRKLKDISTIQAGGDVDNSKINERGKYPVIANALTNDGIVGYYNDEYRIKAPAVTVTGRGDVGHAQARMVDFTPVVRLLALNTKHDVNFIANAINTKRIIVESTGVPQLTVPQLENYEIKVTSEKEENKIGDLFVKLDNLITLHQRKYDKLVNVKKALLEKMFPKNDSNVPEIRFKGFTEAWEQRKLKDICEKFTDGDWIEAKDQSESGIRLVQTGNVGVTQYLEKSNNKKWISLDTFDKLHCKEIFEGDILISRLPEPAGRACIMPDIGKRMITAVDCTIVRLKKKYNNKYVVQYLSTNKYFNEVNTCLAGGTRQRISRNNLSNFDIPIPKNILEQKQIGTLFNKVDNLITLHQRKLEKLKNIKKSLLEKMFV